jgi:hypothetical protein
MEKLLAPAVDGDGEAPRAASTLEMLAVVNHRGFAALQPAVEEVEEIGVAHHAPPARPG